MRHLPVYIGGSIILTAAVTLSQVNAADPVEAFQIQVFPTQPVLGDTIVLTISSAAANGPAPQVRSDDKLYNSFPLGQNRYRAFVPTNPLQTPGKRTFQVQVMGRSQPIAVTIANRSFRIQRINLPPGKAGVSATPHEMARVNAARELVTPIKYWNGKFIAPSRASRSSPYGVKRYYNGVFARDYYHRGLDFAGASGSPVTAPAAGKVVLVGRLEDGFRVHGNVVGVDHGQGVISIFMHLSRIDVREGQTLQTGELVGGVGTTGASTGPHLHWGLFVNNMAVEPERWLATSFD
jgi:lysostaphin